MTFVRSLLRGLTERDMTTPRLVWYGPEYERIELSGRVLDNWVSKTANLLVDEFDVGPGDGVAILTPPHWRSLVFGLAAWSIGAKVTIGASGPDTEETDTETTDAQAAAVFTSSPTGEGNELAVALPGLAMRFDGDTAGALDYNAEVRSFPDVFTPGDDAGPAATDMALRHPGGTLDYEALETAVTDGQDKTVAANGQDATGVTGGPEHGQGVRVLVSAAEILDADFYLGALRALHRRGTFVIVDSRLADRLERISADEGISPPN